MSPLAGSAEVVAAHGRRGILDDGGRRLPFITKGRRLRVVCGDRVDYELRPGSEAVLVTDIGPRSNALARVNLRYRRGEIIAANISQLVVVCAPEPKPEALLLDRCSCTAELLGCELLVVYNKYDLSPEAPAVARELEALGYPLISVSAQDGTGLEQLREALDGHTSVFMGQSGVGKSSLVNALFPDAGAGVGELSPGVALGTHTTTAVVMYADGKDLRVLDTPGVRDFLPALPSTQPLDQGFREIRRLAADCRFSNCSHTHEPGCAVKQGLDEGLVSERRHESYCQLLETLRDAPGSGSD